MLRLDIPVVGGSQDCVGLGFPAARRRARGDHDLLSQAAVGLGTADRAGGRWLVTGLLGGLQQGLWSADFLDGVTVLGLGLHGGSTDRHEALAGAATDRSTPYPAAVGARSPSLPRGVHAGCHPVGDRLRGGLPGPDVRLVLRCQPGTD